MLILKIIAALVVAFFAWGFLINFNRYTAERFGHRFFGWLTLVLGAGASWCVVGGVNWAKTSQANGVVLAAVGVAVLVALVVVNVRRTTLLVGLGGSVLQMGAFVAVGVLGLAFIPVVLFICVMAMLGGPDTETRQYRLYEDQHS